METKKVGKKVKSKTKRLGTRGRQLDSSYDRTLHVL